jgi:shikimate kinase
MNAGAEFIGGEEWLIHQGIHACRHFLGFFPERGIPASALETPASKKRIISLTGFMASGKSSVGQQLAAKLGYEFADTDSIIEQKQSMSINDIFKQFGEEKFREMESDVLLSFNGKNNIVVSCGGGAVLRDENRKFLSEETIPFWLYTSMEETLRRGNDGTRPLLKDMNRPEQLMELFEKRKHLYASLYGTLVISEGDPEQIMELINEEIRLSL